MSRADSARDAWHTITKLFLADETHDRFHEACSSIGLPHPGSLKALLLLEEGDPPSMRSMAEGMHCDASYITGLVDALEGQGYVERVVSPVDRRVKFIHLTPAGAAAKDTALAVLATPPKSMERLTAAETRTLAQLLSKLL